MCKRAPNVLVAVSDSDHIPVEIVPETTTISTTTDASGINNVTVSDEDGSGDGNVTTGKTASFFLQHCIGSMILTLIQVGTTESTTEHLSLDGDIFDKFKNVSDSNNDDDDQGADPVWDQQAIDGALPRSSGREGKE